MLIVPPRKLCTDEEFAASLARAADLANERGGPYSCVIDLRDSHGLTASQRKLQAEFMDDWDAHGGAQLVTAALVFESAPLRGMVTALMWMRPSTRNLKVFPTVPAAKAWALARVREHEGLRSTGSAG